jgi:hypothetical protein
MKNTDLAKEIATLRHSLENDGHRAAATSHINRMVEAHPGKAARKLAIEFVAFAKSEIAKQNAERIARAAQFAQYHAA